MSGYSPLDLYLMGMIPKEQVPPLTLIVNPAIDRRMTPEPGATISGTARTVTIGDIVAAMGERMPDAANAQKQFKVGFVLLTRPGTAAGTAPAAMEILRSAWAGKFAELTGGKGRAQGVAPSLAVNIDTPTDGATITGPDTVVTGTVLNSTGAETGVTVNGMPATVSGSKFIVNHLPLQEGSNTLTITATDANGLTSTTTRNVTAQIGHYLRISSNFDSGTGPLEVSLRLNGSFSIANPSVSIAGPAASVLLPGTNGNEYTLKMTVEGQYEVIASAVGPDGQAYTDSLTVTVVSKAQLDNLLKAKWGSMRTALAVGDVAGAIANFSEFTKDSYQEEFTAIAASLPQVAASMANITMVKVEENIAEYDLRDVIDGVVYSYYLQFIKGADGIWKIRNF